MAITKTTEVTAVITQEDGQMVVTEADFYYDDVAETTSAPVNQRRRRIDLDEDVSAEDALIQDVASGVRTTDRVNARAAAKAAEQAEI